MKIIHYSAEIIERLDERPYIQSEISWQAKPAGLWISIEGMPNTPNNQTWKEWCEQEDFCVENLKYPYEISLKEHANILHLKTPEEIFEFTKKFPLKSRDWDTHRIDWDEVKSLYQGIIIAPYQWSCRLSLESCWYYGWDIASGCLWDLKCIKEFKRIENEL